MADRRRSIKEIHAETKLLHDAAAARAAARQRQLYLGLQPATRLRKYGVGVPPLWPIGPSRTLRFAPQGMQMFQQMFGPPASWLWVVAHTADTFVASVHVEFVDDIARVSEAIDIGADAIGDKYRLTAEPVDTAIDRCLDVLGFGAERVGWRTRCNAAFPFGWTGGAPHVVPAESKRLLNIRFEPAPDGGATPVVEKDTRSHCDDVAPLAAAPTREEVSDVLRAFFRPGSSR